MKLDAFTHIFPKRYWERMLEVAPPALARRRGVDSPRSATWPIDHRRCAFRTKGKPKPDAAIVPRWKGLPMDDDLITIAKDTRRATRDARGGSRACVARRDSSGGSLPQRP